MLCSKIVRHLDLLSLDALGPLVAPSLCLGHYNQGHSGYLKALEPSVLVSIGTHYRDTL
jgi:hypothetical protein